MPRPRGVGAHHDARREHILGAVQAVAARAGIGAVSQSAVAAQAGVSPGRVQHYFPTKDALLEATFTMLNEQSSERIEELVDTVDEPGRPRRVLEVVLTELIPHDEATRAHLQFRQAYTGLALHHRGVADELRSAYRRLHHDDLAGQLATDQHAGLLPRDLDRVAAAVRLTALAEGLAYYVLIDVVDPDDARAQVLDEIARLYRAPS